MKKEDKKKININISECVVLTTSGASSVIIKPDKRI